MLWPSAGGRWLRGELELQVTTADPAALLSALLEDGIGFRQAGGPPAAFRLRIALADFRRLRPAAFRSRARVRIGTRSGAPFLIRHLRRRPALLASALLAAAVLQLLAGHVWLVRVAGTALVAPAEVLHAAAQLGLRPGASRQAIDAGALGARLPVVVPELAFAAVHLQGVLAVIEVGERARPRLAYEQAVVPGDIVAAQAGIVTGLSVGAGQAMVSPGTAVAAGQVLIAGTVAMPASRAAGAPRHEVRIHASGVVLARRWYAAYAEAARAVPVGVPTGRSYIRRWLQLGPWRLPLQGLRRVPFAAYSLARRTTAPPVWRGIALPVEVTTARYEEVTQHVRWLSLTDAGDLAAAQARTFLIPHLPPHARILEERQRAVSLPGGRVGVELQVESEDNIGVFRPAEPASGAGGPAPGAS